MRVDGINGANIKPNIQNIISMTITAITTYNSNIKIDVIISL